MSKNKMNQVGIDVSAKTLNVCMYVDGINQKQGEFDNTVSGHKKLVSFITKHGAHAKVCMEATGVYHLKLANHLHALKKVELMVVNPKAMKHFSTALLKRAKTDKVDAEIIAQYLMRMDFVHWCPPSDHAQTIQALSQRIGQLTGERAREKARLSNNAYRHRAWRAIEKDITAHIKQLTKRIEALEDKLSEAIKGQQSYADQQKLLQSVKGIGVRASEQILAEVIGMPNDLAPDQAVAYAGLDPKPVESGSSINKPRKVSKAGNKRLRSALFMPALVAIQSQNNVKRFYEKLLAKGKTKMQAIVAVMRKLLRCIFGMLKTGTTWDGNKFYKI